MHINRIKGLLIQQGIDIKYPSWKRFLSELTCVRTWDGKELQVEFKDRMVRKHQRLKMVVYRRAHRSMLFELFLLGKGARVSAWCQRKHRLRRWVIFMNRF